MARYPTFDLAPHSCPPTPALPDVSLPRNDNATLFQSVLEDRTFKDMALERGILGNQKSAKRCRRTFTVSKFSFEVASNATTVFVHALLL